MKKVIAIAILLCSMSFSQLSATAFSVQSEIALVQSLDTYEIYFDQNAGQITAPASLTKMMTALVTVSQLHSIDLANSEVTITENMIAPLRGSGATVLHLKAGMRLTIYDLLAGLLLVSAADAATALEHYVEEYTGIPFITMMNEYARAFGMHHTTFANSTGLDDARQKTTAYDMVILLDHFRQDPLLRELFAKTSHTIELKATQTERKTLKNSTLFQMKQLGSESMQGGKTGYTLDAGYCLATFHDDGTHRYAIVVMKLNQEVHPYGQLFNETHRLEQFAKKAITEKVFFQANEIAHTLDVTGSADQKVDLIVKERVFARADSAEKLSNYQIVYEGPFSLSGPIEYGAEIGSLVLQDGVVEIKRIPLFAATQVEKGNVKERLLAIVEAFWLEMVLLILFYAYRIHSKTKKLRKVQPTKVRRF